MGFKVLPVYPGALLGEGEVALLTATPTRHDMEELADRTTGRTRAEPTLLFPKDSGWGIENSL